MAKQVQPDNQIKSVLKYSASYPYFGSFKFADLYDAQHCMRRNEFHQELGYRDAPVYIGKINGDVICGALWRLMGYNPGRFTNNPFLYDGENNIFKFAKDTVPYSADTDANKIISDLRYKLREYLYANAGLNGQWRDEIDTEKGYVYTVLSGGRTGNTYKKLRILRKAIQLITQQNCLDFDAKTMPYRDQIIQVVQNRHPEMFEQITGNSNPQSVAKPVTASAKKTVAQSVASVPTIAEPTADELIAEKIYEKMDHLQITLDNRASISSELYEQARAEMSRLTDELYAMQRRHTL